MAQVSFRINDASKALADQILEQQGLSLGGYLQGIVEYIAKNGVLPVVIEFRSVALNPEEVFQEAIFQFREAYVNFSAFRQKELKVNHMAPMDKLRSHIDAIDVAQQFYQRHEAIIRQAPSQLQNIDGDEPAYLAMFPRCVEYFPPLSGYLRQAVRCVNMNNRPIQQFDLDEQESALMRAAETINILQGMANTAVTADILTHFMLRDMAEAISCARGATRERITYILARGWQQRMSMAFGEAQKKYRRLGTSEQDVAMAKLKDDMLRAVDAVDRYLNTTSEPMTGFNPEILDVAENGLNEMLSILGYLPVVTKTVGHQAD